MEQPQTQPQPFTERDIRRMARAKAIRHYTRDSKPDRQVSIDVHVHVPINWTRVLILTIAVLAILAFLIACATSVRAAAPASALTPLCERSRVTGVTTIRTYTLRSTWQMHVKNGAKPARQRHGKWECR